MPTPSAAFLFFCKAEFSQLFQLLHHYLEAVRERRWTHQAKSIPVNLFCLLGDTWWYCLIISVGVSTFQWKVKLKAHNDKQMCLMHYDWTVDGQKIKQCHSLNHFCFCFEQVGGWKLPEWMSYGSHRLLSWWCTALTSFKAVEDTVLSSRAHMGTAELRTRHTLTKDMAKSTKCLTDDTTLAECVGLWPHASRNSTIISTKSATSSIALTSMAMRK